jgi:hypothetical protein
MELFAELTTIERIAWGLLSFIALIVYLRWEGSREVQKVPKERERQSRNDRTDKLSNKYAEELDTLRL